MKTRDWRTVSFGRSIGSEEIHGLLAYVQEMVGLRSISCTITCQMNIPQHISVEPLPDTHPDLSSFNVNATCYPSSLQMVNGPAMLTLEGYRESGTDPRLLDGFRFVTAPGYDEHELPRGECEIMTRTREVMEDYVRNVLPAAEKRA